MSEGPEETPVHVDTVFTDTSKGNGSLYEITSDSGVDTYDSCSAICPLSSDSEVSPIKHSETTIKVLVSEPVVVSNENGLTSSVSISPDNNDLNDRLMNCNESPVHDNEHIYQKNKAIDSADENHSCNEVLTNYHKDGYEISKKDLNNLKNTTINSSSTSLDDNHNGNSTIRKSFSRSAENISMEPQKIDMSMKAINTDDILAQFASQKSKAGAMQKIPENLQTTHSLDVRYTRIPKELLPQDLGSIVKNVHGIFSSVSGSLKSAYNHRVLPQQKVPTKIKNIPNGKLMKEIFEDGIEDRPPINNEKTNETEVPDDLKMECVNEDDSKEALKSKLESLEKLLAEQRQESGLLRERVRQQIDELQEKDQAVKEFEVKFDLMGKRVEQAEREKDAAVMRYASVECASIEAKRAAERAAGAERAAAAESELLNNKLKSAHAEKHRICQLYDDKCHELSTSEREASKVREELRELEGRLKWTQSKLRVEMDAYKESSERVEKLTQQMSELEAAKEAAVTNAADTARAKQLELELKECRAALILCRHEREALEKKTNSATQQLEKCRAERDSSCEALTRSIAEVEVLKMSNLRLEEEAAELAALRAQAALADTLAAQLDRETERATKAEEALIESRALAETCARREALALEHSAKLTAQHVAERATAAQRDSKAQALTMDNASLRERVSALEAECAQLNAALGEEADRRNKENRVLARKVAELTEEVADANKRLEWEKGENGVLKKKHASAIKELNRELQRSLKRCGQLEARLPAADAPHTRTGSVTSLSSGESAADDRLQAAVPDVQVREPDKQALIERIVSLQRAAARRSERCEFLEEHSRQLTSELRSKSRLLRQLLCNMPAGAVTSQHRDMNKKEMARLGGGAMAAVWGGAADGMTLELSIEMNRRLQAVLEDALLKNITLKENMDTLGAEISRLKEQSKPDQK